MDSRILEQLEEAYGEELALVEGDLGRLEQKVGTIVKSLGMGLLQRLVDRGRNGYQGTSIACSCGGSLRFVGHRPKEVHTVFGWITVSRAYDHCPACGHSVVPYDRASGLGAGPVSPALAKACGVLAVDLSFGGVSQKIRQLYGEEVSDTTVERLVHQVGSVSIQQQERERQRFQTERQILVAQVQPKRLYVSVDGTMVQEEDAWHEAKTGCIYWYDERFQLHKCYVGRFCDSEEFGWLMWLAACRHGLREAEEVVYLGDGAPWIRTEHDRHFPQATFIVDWYHASKHVWDCGKVLFGQAPALVEPWVEARLSLLWEGQIQKLREDLQEQHRQHRGAKREALADLCRYLSTNEEQMHYDVFRARGYDIGSGAVEGACDYVVGRRLKQSGMIWSRAGSSATLALRICWLNGQWDSFWEQKPLAA